MYLSKRYKIELNRKTLCKFTPTLFSSSSITRITGFNNFTFLEKRFRDSIKEFEEIRETVYHNGRLSQREKKVAIGDIDMRIEFYKRCLALLDFYKKV